MRILAAMALALSASTAQAQEAPYECLPPSEIQAYHELRGHVPVASRWGEDGLFYVLIHDTETDTYVVIAGVPGVIFCFIERHDLDPRLLDPAAKRI